MAGLKPVTDPGLLQQLNAGPTPASPVGALRPVTDERVLFELNNGGSSSKRAQTAKPLGGFQDFAESVAAPGEMALTLGTGAIGGLVGNIAGLARSMTGSQYGFGTPEAAQEGAQRAKEVSHALTYQPRGELAKAGMQTLGDMFSASRLQGLGPTEGLALSSLPVREGIVVATQPFRNTVREMFHKPPAQMAGVGAAETAPEAIRRARATDLPVPINLTKGQATRDFGQQRFERETAKAEVTGAPLRQRYAQQNEDIIKNFDSWIDDTGATAPSLRLTGNAVDDALVARANFVKGKYRDAYTKARDAGELATPVSVAPLVEWVETNRSAAKLAPIIAAAENEIIRLGGATRGKDGKLVPGNLSLNDIENTRKLIVRLSKVDETNGHYGGQANKVIDTMTEGQGGNLYKEARGLFKEYAAEFKNQGVIKKLLGTKPGTTDRAVAFEDVFKQSILSGSRDDTAAVFRSLEQAGPKGATAISELKGATMSYLKDEATKNSARDIMGNPILSYDKLNRAVRELEVDGKLELVFGKKQAANIRDITELVADVHTAPPGAVNTSNTGAVLLDALGSAVTGHIPTATAKVIGVLKEQVGNRAINKRVRESLTVH